MYKVVVLVCNYSSDCSGLKPALKSSPICLWNYTINVPELSPVSEIPQIAVVKSPCKNVREDTFFREEYGSCEQHTKLIASQTRVDCCSIWYMFDLVKGLI